MCDTISAVPVSTAKKITLFGKNSDRERVEAQAVEIHPAVEHAANAELACTYISIPQIRRTNAVLLSRPFWMWGAEMGANEHGVVIGNEAVFARTPPQEEKALLGMDLLRLGLERAATAAEAVEVISQLLERYGQGGNCGLLAPSFYHNSFIIADPKEAFVLETFERQWLIEKVRNVRAISNALTIGKDPTRKSPQLDAFIREHGWSNEETYDYADVISDPEKLGSGRTRCARSTTRLRNGDGYLTAADMMAILRDHGADAHNGPEWNPLQSPDPSVCAHATTHKPRGQTVGSLVSEIYKEQPVHWITATAAPCVSVFKPVFLDVALPAHGPKPTGESDIDTLWWRHEKLREVLFDGPAGKLAAFRTERDALEADFRRRVNAVLGGSVKERGAVVSACWNEAIAMENRWLADASEALAAQ